MKNKKIIILILFVCISTLIYFLKFRCYRTLPEITNYKIVSDLGIVIPAKLYSREVKTTVKGKEKVIHEIVIHFNDSLIDNKSNLSSQQRVSKFLLIIPELQMIGLMNKPTKSFKIKKDCICQTDKSADTFKSIVNNYALYSDPLIKRASFTNNKITFNTFGILKQFGDSIVIEIK